MTGQEFWGRAPGLWRKEVFIAEFDSAIAQAKQEAFEDEHARFKARGAELDRKDQQIADLQTTLEVAERERDRFQRVGKHYESLLGKAAELLEPGGTGRTCALVVSQDLPKLLAERDTIQAKLDQVPPLEYVAALADKVEILSKEVKRLKDANEHWHVRMRSVLREREGNE